MPICLKDNTQNQCSIKESCDDIRKALKDIGGKTFAQLRNQNEGFLIFPPVVKDADLKEDDVVLNVNDSGESLSFSTGNVMGFFGVDREHHFQIQSRFDSENKNYFLHYLLQKVCNVAYTPRTNVGEDAFFDFIYFLFPNYLKSAVNQGVYRTYVTKKYNDANVRGPIDVNRHIRYNVPFNGKVAYNTREYTVDNNLTQLIRHTIEFIRLLPVGETILNGGFGKTRENVSAIVQATPSYSRNDRVAIIARNLRPVSHPYYTAYEPLRRLCLAILRGQKLSYGDRDDDSINGILFDGASLWEEYLNVLMRGKVNLFHPNNRTGSGVQYAFKKKGTNYRYGKMYPDFLIDCTMENDNVKAAKCVLDAKYKDIGVQKEYGIRSVPGEDLCQMLLYMSRFNAKQSLILHPVKNKEDYKNLEYEMIGNPSFSVKTIPFEVPAYDNDCSFEEYLNKMHESETKFVEELKKNMTNVNHERC